MKSFAVLMARLLVCGMFFAPMAPAYAANQSAFDKASLPSTMLQFSTDGRNKNGKNHGADFILRKKALAEIR